MSTLKVDNLLNAAGNESPISVPGAAKAWVNFNGTGTVSIRNSFNVSSITDNGLGDYTITLTNALGNSNYCIQLSATDDGSGAQSQANGYVYGGWARGANSTALTASSARIQIGYPANATLYDQSHVMVNFFGD